MSWLGLRLQRSPAVREFLEQERARHMRNLPEAYEVLHGAAIDIRAE